MMFYRRRIMLRNIAMVVVLAGLLSACASRPGPPDEQVGAARSAIGSAEDAGARDYAPVALRQAQQLLEQAETERSRGEYAAARRLAGEAEMEARYAAFHARSARSEEMIAELTASIQDLREEIQAGSGGEQ